MKKNYALDFLKVLFMIIIILHHSHLFDAWLIRGYICVEFFFIVSGYFLAQTYKRNTELTTGQYLKRRISKLYPYYFVAFALLSILYALKKKGLPYKSILSGVSELFMIQNTIIPLGGGINYPLWYISVLITASALIYMLLRSMPIKKFNCISITTIICVYTYLIYQGNIEQWSCVFIFYLPWWRGLADMLIGVILYEIVLYFKSKKLKNYISIVMEIVTFSGTIILLFFKGNYDYLAVLFIIGLIFTVSLNSVIFDFVGKSRLFRELSKYEYIAYLNHALIIVILNKIDQIMDLSFSSNLILLIAAISIYSVVFKLVVDKTIQIIKKKLIKN